MKRDIKIFGITMLIVGLGGSLVLYLIAYSWGIKSFWYMLKFYTILWQVYVGIWLVGTFFLWIARLYQFKWRKNEIIKKYRKAK
ncbi:MAG: hypothetical protein HGB12_00145 [Bacteroidetes bacterium]|nr:hypothetical protein [Bacteroidota bacterium]